MIDVFIDVLEKLSEDKIYNKVIDPSIAFSTFYAILTDSQLVEQILGRYFRSYEQASGKTPILCLCEHLFGEKRAADLVRRGPIASSKVADLAERLHATICINHPSPKASQRDLSTGIDKSIGDSSTLAYLRTLINQLADTLNPSKGPPSQHTQQASLVLLKKMAAAIDSFTLEQTSSQLISASNLEKDEQIKALTARVNELEEGLSDMCNRVGVYMQQMETYSREMAIKNDQILVLHQQLKKVHDGSDRQELASLQEQLESQTREVSHLHTELGTSSVTIERLTQECMHLSKRNEMLSSFEPLLHEALNTLTSLSTKDLKLSYPPPTSSTPQAVPQYIANAIETIRTKAHWLISEAAERALPPPSQDTSPMLDQFNLLYSTQHTPKQIGYYSSAFTETNSIPVTTATSKVTSDIDTKQADTAWSMHLQDTNHDTAEPKATREPTTPDRTPSRFSRSVTQETAIGTRRASGILQRLAMVGK